MSEYFDLVRPTYLENWPAALCRLSIAQVDVPLTLAEAEALGTNIIDWCDTFPPPRGRDLSSIRARLTGALAVFPAGAFVRLGSRSPKDAWYAAARVFSAEAALARLCDCSERISDDLHLAIAEGYAPHIFLRQWIELEDWQELRCFMRARKLVGISQYFYREAFPELERYADSIEWAIRQLFFPKFGATCHLEDCVFDVYVRVRERSGARETEVKLLEINPLFEMTDPCLFDWRRAEDFDGSFRKVAAR